MGSSERARWDGCKGAPQRAGVRVKIDGLFPFYRADEAAYRGTGLCPGPSKPSPPAAGQGCNALQCGHDPACDRCGSDDGLGTAELAGWGQWRARTRASEAERGAADLGKLVAD